jgi:hypothetical protein
MKKLKTVLLLTVLTLMICSFKSPVKSDWGPWVQSSCYGGIYFSVKNDNYNKYADKYDWRVRFKNKYEEAIHINFVVKASNVSTATTTHRCTVIAGSVSEEFFFLVPDANSVMVFIDKVRFGADSGPYAKCD